MQAHERLPHLRLCPEPPTAAGQPEGALRESKEALAAEAVHTNMYILFFCCLISLLFSVFSYSHICLFRYVYVYM